MILALALYLRTGVGPGLLLRGDLLRTVLPTGISWDSRDVDVCGGRRRGHGHDLMGDVGRSANAPPPALWGFSLKKVVMVTGDTARSGPRVASAPSASETGRLGRG